MKSQKLRQSKIFVGLNSNRSEVLEQQFQFDNPENNFQKLMTMPPDQPGKQLRNLIQSMSEHCSFQKNIIKKTSAIQIPNYVRSEIKRNQIYKDYETIKNFTIFSKKKQHFEARKFASVSRTSSTGSHLSPQQNRGEKSSRGGTKSSKKKIKVVKKSMIESKPISMFQFVELKKNKMLMEDNILKTDQNNVSNILGNNKKREKLFEQALLLERLYDIEIEKLKKVGVTENGNQVPEKFRGIDPKHIRITSQICQTEQEYLRKKYVCKKRKLQYYNHAKKIEQLSLKNKKKQNLGVLQTLMKFNEASDKKQSSTYLVKASKITKQNNIYEQDLKIKRLFLKYSNTEAENPDQLYKYITEKQLLAFFADFDLTQKVNHNKQLKKYIERKKEETNKMVRSYVEVQRTLKIYLFDFLEIIYILAAENSHQKSTCNIAPFLDTFIWSKNEKVAPQLWQKLKKIKRSAKTIKYLKTLKFEEIAQQIFLKQMKKSSKNYSANPLLTFNDILEISWQLKLFPTTISKKQLRFLYLYSKSDQNGISQLDFYDMIVIIGLKYSPHQTVDQKLKWIANIMHNKSLMQAK